MTQLRETCDKAASSLAEGVDQLVLSEVLELIVKAPGKMVVEVLSGLDPEVTKQIIIIGLTMVLVAKLEKS